MCKTSECLFLKPSYKHEDLKGVKEVNPFTQEIPHPILKAIFK